ncbi:hypothetical protein WA158_007940 [Blastocystis sp. Blastoise]
MFSSYLTSIIISFFQTLLTTVLSPLFFVASVVSQIAYYFTTKEEEHHTVLITGATSGIGEGLARKYSKNCSKLILIGRNNEKLSSLKSELSSEQCSVCVHSVDITDKEKMRSIISQYKDIDLVIANAGISSTLLQFDETPSILEQTTERIFETNVNGTFNTLFPAIDNMKLQKHGQICIVASIAGLGGDGINTCYAASKCALTSYAEGLRSILEPYNIKVNIVTPSPVATRMINSNGSSDPLTLTVDQCVNYIYNGIRDDMLYIYCNPIFFILLTLIYKVMPVTLKRVYLQFQTYLRHIHVDGCEYYEPQDVKMKSYTKSTKSE